MAKIIKKDFGPGIGSKLVVEDCDTLPDNDYPRRLFVAQGIAYGAIRRFGDLKGLLEKPQAAARVFDINPEIINLDGSTSPWTNMAPATPPHPRTGETDQYGNILDGEEEE